MGVPDTIGQCKNCGEPVIQYNNTGAWRHYPEHPLNSPGTLCMMPNIIIEVATIPGLPLSAYDAEEKM